MDFGFTLKPDHPLDRVVRLAKLAERSGFAYGWVFDSHVLWKEPYVLLALMAQNTSRLRLGTCVTNPATREPYVTASHLAVTHLRRACACESVSRIPWRAPCPLPPRTGWSGAPRGLGTSGARRAPRDPAAPAAGSSATACSRVAGFGTHVPRRSREVFCAMSASS